MRIGELLRIKACWGSSIAQESNHTDKFWMFKLNAYEKNKSSMWRIKSVFYFPQSQPQDVILYPSE